MGIGLSLFSNCTLLNIRIFNKCQIYISLLVVMEQAKLLPLILCCRKCFIVDLCEFWIVIDNSNRPYALIAEGSLNNEPIIHNSEIWQLLKDQANEKRISE